MANARALDKRRKSIRNIRKITRTMELIATARFKKAMDRATAASAYTERMTRLVGDLAAGGLELDHPLMQARDETNRAVLLVLTSNRGLCGGFNGNVVRSALSRWKEMEQITSRELEVSGKRGIGAFRYRNIPVSESFTHFEDKPRYDEVDVLASRYLEEYATGKLDRFDVAYMRFETAARQVPVVETLLPLQSLDAPDDATEDQEKRSGAESMYEFDPSAESILHEVVPASFKVKLFKCFLDAAVSEQIARMVAMKGATENAGELIKQLSMTYNRARQSQITGEIMEIIGGVEALNN